MSNQFGFQTEDRVSPVVDDPRIWGKVAEFVTQHPQDVGCARPFYVRATVGYSRGCIEVVGREDTWKERFLTGLYKAIPVLFGAKVVLCGACQNMVFISPWQERVWRFFQSLSPDPDAKMLILDEDAGNVPKDRMKEFSADA